MFREGEKGQDCVTPAATARLRRLGEAPDQPQCCPLRNNHWAASPRLPNDFRLPGQGHPGAARQIVAEVATMRGLTTPPHFCCIFGLGRSRRCSFVPNSSKTFRSLPLSGQAVAGRIESPAAPRIATAPRVASRPVGRSKACVLRPDRGAPVRSRKPPRRLREGWCPRSDSNRQASRRRILSPLRLPIPPLGPKRYLQKAASGVNSLGPRRAWSAQPPAVGH